MRSPEYPTTRAEAEAHIFMAAFFLQRELLLNTPSLVVPRTSRGTTYPRVRPIRNLSELN